MKERETEMNTIATPLTSVPSSSYNVFEYQNHLNYESSSLMTLPSFGEFQVVGSASTGKGSTIGSAAATASAAAACNTRFVSPRHESEDDEEVCEDFYRALKQAYAEDARLAAEIANEFVHDISDDEVSATTSMDWEDDDNMMENSLSSTSFYFTYRPIQSSYCMLYDTCYPDSAIVMDAGESSGEAAFNAKRCITPSFH
jgi:hypothetical protein